jgi:hypothetical protein
VSVDNDQILTITNSSAVNGGADPESIKDIKSQSKLFAHAQYRNVTKYDYIVYLTAHNQISKSIV